MSDPQQEPRFDRPVLNGLVALLAVALGVGLILALVALMGSRFLGIGDGGDSSAAGSTVRESMYLPTPVETAGSGGPRITLNTESPEESQSTDESDFEETEETAESEATESESPESGEISLQAVDSSVAADERIYFSGSTPAAKARSSGSSASRTATGQTSRPAWASPTAPSRATSSPARAGSTGSG